MHLITSVVAVFILVSSLLPALETNPYHESAWQRVSQRLFDNTIGNIIGKSTHEMAVLGDFKQGFGSDEFIQLVVSGTGPLDKRIFSSIGSFILDLELRYSGIEVLWAGRLPHAPDGLKLNKEISMSAIQAFLKRLKLDPVAERMLRFDDASWDMALFIPMPAGSISDSDRARFIQFVKTTWQQTKAAKKWHSEIIGVPILLSTLRDSLETAMTVNFPLVNLIIIGICWLVARRLRLVLLMYLPLLQAEIWLIAAFIGFGNSYNYITGNMSTIVMVIGTTINIHILSAYVVERTRHNRQNALYKTFEHVAKPIGFAIATTTIALLSFSISSNLGIRNFGIFASAGVIAALFCSFTLLPAVVSVFDKAPVTAPKFGSFIPLMLKLPIWAWNRPRLVISLTSIAVIIGLFGITFLKVGTNIHGYFMPGSEIRQALDYTESRFPGYIPFEAVVQLPNHDAVDGPALITLSRRIEAAIHHNTRAEGHPLKRSQILGISDLVDSFCLDPDKKKLCPDGRPRPKVADALIESLTSAAGTSYIHRKAGSYQLRFTVFYNPKYAEGAVTLIADLRRTIETVSGPEAKVTITGMSSLWSRHDVAMTKSLMTSLLLSASTILLLMLLIYRGWRPFLISILPNAAPMIIVLGITGFFCVAFSGQLPSAAFMFTTVAAGIIVDDTLFFLLTYQTNVLAGKSGEMALRTSLATVGPGVILTGISLSVGTATLLMGELVPIKVFGGLLSLTVGVALLADLLILPALCRLYWNPTDDKP